MKHVFTLAFIISCIVAGSMSLDLLAQYAYKQGQLDYQAGKIEWTVIDGKVHHIEAKHE